MENGPFIEDFPIKTSIYEGFSMAMLNNQMVYIYICYMILYITIINYTCIVFFRGSEGCGKFQHVSGFGKFFHMLTSLAEPL